MYNILIWSMLISQNVLRLPVPYFFLAPFLSPFSALFFAFHVLSGCRKKLSVNYGQSRNGIDNRLLCGEIYPSSAKCLSRISGHI